MHFLQRCVVIAIFPVPKWLFKYSDVSCLFWGVFSVDLDVFLKHKAPPSNSTLMWSDESPKGASFSFKSCHDQSQKHLEQIYIISKSAVSMTKC